MFAESSSLAWFYEETFRWGPLSTEGIAAMAWKRPGF